MIEKWKQIPLGIPLTIASIGTLVTLNANKQLHAGFGILWTGLSLWHGLQHCKKLKQDTKKLTGIKCMPAAAPAAADSPLKQLLNTLQVTSFSEGRVRIRSPWFVENPTLQKQVEEYVASFTGVKKAMITPMTGSLLIEYQPEKLRKKPKLAQLEEQLKAAAK